MTSTSKSGKARGFINRVFRRSKNACGFLLNKDQISGMVRDVEHAQKQLSMALTLASINASESWRSNANQVLGTIKAEMVNHGKTLEKIEENGRLRRAVLEVDPQTIQILGGNAPPIPASTKQPGNPVDFVKGFGNAIKRKLTRQPPKHPLNPNGSVNRATGGTGDDTYEADNESDDDCEPPARQPTAATVPAGDPCGRGPNVVEYGLILRDGKYFQVPLDSEEYNAAAGPSGNAGLGLDHSPAAIRVDEVVESMSDKELDRAQHRPLEELMSGFVTSAPITSYPSDAETATDEPPAVTINIRPPTYVLVAENVSLASCRDGEGAKLSVCIADAWVEGVFCIVEPCSAELKDKCRHITLELEDGPGFAESPPCKIGLDGMRFLDEAAGNVSSSGQSAPPSSVLPSTRQCFRGPCYHTKLLDAQHNRTRCALPIRLSARAVSSELAAPPVTPEPPAEAGNFEWWLRNADNLDVAVRRKAREVSPGSKSSRFGPSDESDDDEYVCELLQEVIQDEAAEIPDKIEWHTFVQFLVLAHKRGWQMPERPCVQARRWVSLFKPPSSFDADNNNNNNDDGDDDDDGSGDALAWLWVMWKLQMVKEFRVLSSIVQRQARNPISHCWQAGPGSRFGIELPDTVIRPLDQKRLEALSRVRDMVSREIEQQRQTYLQVTAAPRSLPQDIRTLTSSLSFGYLTLEGERWLPGDDPTRSLPEFSGVSFDGVSAAVRSMIDLRGWAVDWVLPGGMPNRAAALSILVSVASPLLHTLTGPNRDTTSHQVIVQYPESSPVRFAALVEQVENEEWGVDLTATGS
ncbi:hypothetical protein F5144DRAFT_200402 [Chaetomium tenue]|uniref:Uncharacterized protein n=1 Tax=Chaetomium tenue TaxID=1854479 RepID=A0ACB7PG00_9PEZI|nr:hypothetical protein F5144DRAFT_200402 [Chaetomium globosum]